MSPFFEKKKQAESISDSVNRAWRQSFCCLVFAKSHRFSMFCLYLSMQGIKAVGNVLFLNGQQSERLFLCQLYDKNHTMRRQSNTLHHETVHIIFCVIRNQWRINQASFIFSSQKTTRLKEKESTWRLDFLSAAQSAS